MQLGRAHLWSFLVCAACLVLFLFEGASLGKEGGGIGLMVGVVVETSRKKRREKGAWMRERIALMERVEGEALFWVDDRGRLLWMNETAASFLQDRREIALGEGLWDALRGCRWFREKEEAAVLSEQEVVSFQSRMDALSSRMLLGEEGDRFAVSEEVFVCGRGVLGWKEGIVLGGQQRGERGVLWILCDRKRLESAESQAEEARRMMGSRLLLGALLHDLNNNLNCVIGAMDLVEELDAPSSLLETSRQLIHNAVSSALGVSSRASSLLRKPTDTYASILLRDLLEEWCDFLRWRGVAPNAIVFDTPNDEVIEVWGQVELLRDLWRMIGESILWLGGSGVGVEIRVSFRELTDVWQAEQGGFLLMPGVHDEVICCFAQRDALGLSWANLLSPTLGEEENTLRIMLLACSILLRKHQGAMMIEPFSEDEDRKVCWRVLLPRRTVFGA